MWLIIPSGIYSETILFICSDSALKKIWACEQKEKK